jgi:DAK2 domain fusion protein YloV
VLEALNAEAVRRWSVAAVELLTAYRAEIDALNVFPVPDSDTGSNILTTLRAADAALRSSGIEPASLSGRVTNPEPPPGEPASALAALDAMAAGAAQGALGNSGFIVSQILRGLADAAASAGCWDAAALAAGLDVGAVLARTAVVHPVEGTVLTVARAAADGAGAVAGGGSLAEVATAAVAAAEAALQRTPDQLAALADAGVVDAGGRGLVVLLAALAAVVTDAAPVVTPLPAATRLEPVREMGSPEFGFEVQYLLDAPATGRDDALDALRHGLARIGDSVAVVPAGDGVWNVHVHVNDVGAAIEVGLAAGRPHRISVTRFADAPGGPPSTAPPEADRSVPSGAGVGGGAGRPSRAVWDSAAATAVVAVAPGPGLAHLFGAEGVVVVDGDADDPPTVEAVLAAVRDSGAQQLVLLPNAAPARAVAEATAERARAEGRRISVVPTRSPVQGLAAVAVHDPARRFDDNVVAMAEAAAATRFAELSYAAAEALTAVGICQPGDVLGLIDGEVVEIGRGLLAVAFGLVDRLLGVGAELMTIIVGADAPARIGELIESHVLGRSPFTDVTVYQGGQPGQPVIIGVE